MPTTNFQRKNDYETGNPITDDWLDGIANDAELTRWGYSAITHDDTANYTPGAALDEKVILVVGGALTASRNLVLRTAAGARWWVFNGTGQTVTFKTSGGSGVALPTGFMCLLFCDGTDIRRASPAISTAGNVYVPGEVEIDGALNHDGSTAGFYGVAPTTRPAAFTQTYSTVTRTHSNLTSATLTDSTSGTPGTTLAAVPDPADTPADADALRDDLVANALPSIRNALASLAAQVNALRVDLVNAKGVLNQVIDDHQLNGLLQ